MLFKIPSLLLKQLYNFGSLENTDSGVRFGLKNRLTDVSVVGLGRLAIDGVELAPAAISIELGDGEELAAAAVTADSPLPFPLRRAVVIRADGM